ncbi:MAG: DsbA family protein [Gemmatimonadaceae bacterium]
MRTSLVNGIAFIVAVSLVSAACSSADGHTNNSSPNGAGTTPVAANGVATGASNGVAAPGAAGTATDSLAKVADASRILGSPSAKLWVIKVNDFQCPYCKQWHDAAYPMLIKDYVKTGKIRLAYVNFPLSMHQNAHAAATAAMCAGAQSKFWPMHDTLFASQGKWETEKNPSTTFDSLAKSIGVDVASYHSCLSSPAIASLIAGDQDRAQRGGVSSTPSFWVGSKMIEGAVPAAEMRAAIDQALAAPATAPTTPTPTTGAQ